MSTVDERHDEKFRYVFSVKDGDGVWRYEHDLESVWCAPVVDLPHALRDLRIPPAKAVCPDLLIGFKCMPYVMRYNHFAH